LENKLAMPKLTLTIDSNLNNVSLVGVSIQGLCMLTPLSPEITHDVQLCVVESINNVIEHSYANQTGYQVVITVYLFNDRIMLDIVDTGKGMDEQLRQVVNAPYIKSPSESELPEGGWGLYIIKSKMDEVTYQTINNIHILRLVKLFSPHSSLEKSVEGGFNKINLA
jgi:serine/threonine-protein kinase RsbW